MIGNQEAAGAVCGRELNYKSGQRHGKSYYWNDDGKLEKIKYFKNGKLVKTDTAGTDNFSTEPKDGGADKHVENSGRNPTSPADERQQ